MVAKALEKRLMALETQFGGYHTKVPWNVRSPHSRRPIKCPWLTGGDRMTRHGYAKYYAEVLVRKCPQVIVELGVLRGTGLAIWCELFPFARVIGLDIDPEHFSGAYESLVEKGAFSVNQPEVHRFDELAPDAAQQLTRILAGDQVDLFIDDALHYDHAVLRTFRHAFRHVRSGGAYIIEDNRTAWEKIEKYEARNFGLFTVVERP
jgi:SAM-dependent methyltransferase